MMKSIYGVVALLLLVASPVLADLESLESRLNGEGLEGKAADLKRLFTTAESLTTLQDQLNKLLAVDSSLERCVTYLFGRKENPGEASSFDRVLSAAIDLKAAGVEEEKILPLADAQAKKEDDAIEEGKGKQKKIETEREFLGVSWSLGIALAVDLSGDERIEEAELVNGMVRVKEESSANVGFFWEIHKYWWSNKGWCLKTSKKARGAEGSEDSDEKRDRCDRDDPKETIQEATWGLGPFVGVTTTQDDLIDSFSVGAMYGRRTLGDTASLNFGVGLIYEPDVQVLGDGLEADMPLPEGETEIRFKKEDRWGALVAVSFRF